MNDDRRKRIESLADQLYTIQVEIEKIAKEESEDPHPNPPDGKEGAVVSLNEMVEQLEEIANSVQSIADPNLYA